MKFIINDLKLHDKIIKMEKFCVEKLGKQNFAFFGQIKIRYDQDDFGLILEVLELEVALFKTHEAQLIQTILFNRDSIKFEEEALQPLINE